MAFTPVVDGALALASDVQQVIDALTGVAGSGQAILLTQFSSASTPSLLVKNTGTGGLGLQVQSSSGASLLDVRNAYTSFDEGTLYVDQTNNRVGIDTTTPTTALQVNGTVTATSFAGSFSLGAGSVGTPALHLGSDTDSGLYQPADNQLAISIGGSQVGNWTSTGLTVTGTSQATTLTATGTVVAGVGAVNTPGHTFAGNLTSGLYYATGVRATVGGTERLRLDTSGNVIPVGEGWDNSGGNKALYLSSYAGVPTTTPAVAVTGTAPMVWNSSSNALYIYSGGSWNNVASGGAASSVANTSDVVLNSDSDSSGAGDILLQTKGSTKIKIPVLATAGGVLELVEAATPAAATSGTRRTYFKSDGLQYAIGFSGSEYVVRAKGSTAGTVLRGTGTDTTSYGPVQTADIDTGGQIVKRQLDYHLATDTYSNSNVTGTVWNDLHSDQSFTVDDANSTVEIIVRGNMLCNGQGATQVEITFAIIVDSSTRYQLGGGMLGAVATNVCNPINGGSVFITGLSAGVLAHTVKAQIQPSVSLTALNYLRASTQPTIEFLYIQVVEHKR